MRVVYFQAVSADGSLNSDLMLTARHSGNAFGHVVLNATTSQITLSGGTGQFAGLPCRRRRLGRFGRDLALGRDVPRHVLLRQRGLGAVEGARRRGARRAGPSPRDVFSYWAGQPNVKA